MAVTRIKPIVELPLRSGPGMGYGFSTGDKYTITLVYRTREEAQAARKKLMDAVNGAVESIERWAPDRR